MERYERLQHLVRDYGEATTKQVEFAEKLGHSIISGFAEYIECDPRLVYGIPPDGDFTPRKNYQDACFSSYYDDVSFLEPVSFGLCVEISNLKDSGAAWVRTKVAIQLCGDTVEMSVGNNRPKIALPTDFEGKLDPIFEVIYEDVTQEFTIELGEFESRPKIGFMTG